MNGPDGRVILVLSIRGLTKRFDEFLAVDGVDLDVAPGEIIALLGPSGCGKTTVLRMIAGLARPTAGEIAFEGKPFAAVARGLHLAPEKRNVGMVFQSYALWPHMTVAENVAYPLRLRRVRREERRRRVMEVLGLMGLESLAEASVMRLSGGQQQRVALARALVYAPSLMLFDEPFSNLDAQLRVQMRIELKALRRKVQMTGLFVTHDQLEALSVADRVAIMRAGRIEQVGPPVEVYERPATRFVRDFLGKVVTLPGTVRAVAPSGEMTVEAEGALDGPILARSGTSHAFRAGERAELAIRPEHVDVQRRASESAPPRALGGVIEDLLFTGETYEARLRVGGGAVLLELPATGGWREGEAVALVLALGAVTAWPEEG